VQALGIFLEKESCQIALLEKKNKLFTIKRLQEISLEEARELATEVWTVSCLSIKDVLLRTAENPLKTKRAFLKILPFQLETLLPYSQEEGRVVALFEKKGWFAKKNPSKVTLFCLQEHGYQKHIEDYANKGIVPDGVGCISQALYRFVQHYTQEPTCMTFYETEKAVYSIFIVGGCPVHSFQIDLERFSIAKLALELDRLFYFLQEKYSSGEFFRILLLREGVYLKEALQKLEFYEKFSFVEKESFESQAFYAIPIGLALDALSQDKQRVDFKPVQAISKNTKRTLLRAFKIYAGAAMVATCIVLLGSWLTLKIKESVLEKKVVALMEHYGQESKLSMQTRLPLEQKVLQAEKTLGKLKKSRGYYQMPPSINSLFQQGVFSGAVSLEELEYILESYPSLESPELPYKVLVRCKLASLQPGGVEDFVAGLEKQVGFLEEGQKIQVIKEGESYEVAFYLKTP